MPTYSIESAPLNVIGEVEVDGEWRPGQVWINLEGQRCVKVESIIGNVAASQFRD